MFCVCTLPHDERVSLGRAMVQAREQSGLKLSSIGHLMGISAQAVHQMERGEREASMARLLLLRTDVDGRRYLDCFVRALATLAGVEQTDALVAAVLALVEPVRARMAKAEIRPEQKARTA